jgi:EAL domain-containing protein (putative c-di-GMP-specific phosphodiesterase class I)
MEVLLRWRRPGEGLVLPDHFIPIIEENGLIVPIGEWVMRRACEQSVEWQRMGCRRCRWRSTCRRASSCTAA